jgi:hypothetical protein
VRPPACSAMHCPHFTSGPWRADQVQSCLHRALCWHASAHGWLLAGDVLIWKILNVYMLGRSAVSGLALLLLLLLLPVSDYHVPS